MVILTGTGGRPSPRANSVRLDAGIGQRTDKVDRWKNSNQRQRWVAAAALEIEPRLRKVCGYKHLAKLQAALRTIDQAEAA